MKKIIGLFFLCGAFLSIQGISYAQSGAPNGINYQAVIRDNLGTLVSNSPVAIRINIRQNSASGIVIFSEKHLVTTTQYGLVNFVIGAGTYLGLGGPFASINWGNGPYFLDLGVAFSGLPNPTSYMAYGTQQMMSVPFALYAKSSGNLLNQWKYGTGVPAVNLGTAGDYYLDTATGNVYSKTNGTTWILISNIMGPQGPLGLTGAQGIQGVPGPTGAVGATGPIGLTGPTGPTGATGPQGIQGLPGTNGTNGAVGATGPIGLTGPAGATGAQGIQGLPGTNGTNGAVGATGPTGPQGNQGLPGANGAIGATGPTGAQGIQGLPGTNGTNGAVGAIGPIGLTGPAGAQGLPGTNGTNGAVGATGPIGLTGPAGAQGIQGLTGATGLTGPAGSQGIQGATGLLNSGTTAGNTAYWNGTTWITNSSNIHNNGVNVGIGTSTPTTKLQVSGAATNTTTFNAGSSSIIDFSQSNLAYTSATTIAITLTNLNDGGAYSLILTSSTNSGIATFTASGFTFKYMGTSAMTAGKTHIYSFIVAGTVVYVSMASEN